MKRLLFFILLIVSFSGVGQDFKKLDVSINEIIDRKATFFVEPLIVDAVMAVDLLKNSMTTNGFNITSNKEDATYIISISFQDRADTGCGGRVIKQLSGQITESKNKSRVLVTFSFKQSGFEGKCTADVMNALAQRLK